MLSISREIAKALTKFALSSPRTNTVVATHRLCGLHTTPAKRSEQVSSEANPDTNNNAAAETADEERRELTAAELKRLKNDRTQVIPVEKSMRYLKSAAYQQTYGDQFVWEQYRRNHKGMFAPRKTRKTCVRKGVISTGNPCPICRDEYLVLDHRNIDLLRQFISPQTGDVLSYSKTGLCQKKHFQLLVAVERAMDHGLLEFDVPFREYDYSEYYGSEAGGGNTGNKVKATNT